MVASQAIDSSHIASQPQRLNGHRLNSSDDRSLASMHRCDQGSSRKPPQQASPRNSRAPQPFLSLDPNTPASEKGADS